MPVRFPPGEIVFEGRAFTELLFAELDGLLAGGACPDGRLELEAADKRITCLIHRARTYLAGQQDDEMFDPVPLKEFPVRARDLDGSRARLVRTDMMQVLLAAVHFRHRPVLHSPNELVSLNYLLEVLGREGQDAIVALERQGVLSLLFLQHGVPARIFPGQLHEDNGQGTPGDRFLRLAYQNPALSGTVEVFKKLNIDPDPDAGTPFAVLSEAAKPPPPVVVVVKIGARVVLQRPFLPPSMMIGRDRLCELTFDNLSISRRHARLAWERGQFTIEDLNSANGTTVNGRRVVRTVIYPGDVIGAGKLEVSLILPKDMPINDPTILLMPKAAAIEGLIVGKGISVTLRANTSLGRSKSCDVPARGLLVKPLHAHILRDPSGMFRLVCLPGNHVRLNGVKISDAFLRNEDLLRIGKSHFRISLKPVTKDKGTDNNGSRD